MFNSCTVIAEETREYKITNPETRRKRQAYNKLWRSNHKEHVRAYRKMYNAKRKLERIKNAEATTVVTPIVAQEPQGKLCVRCGKNPRMQHRTICRECRNESKRKYYHDRKNPGWHPVTERLCRDCGKVVCTGKQRVCDECRKKHDRQYAANYYRTHKQKWEALSEKRREEVTKQNVELCTRCGKNPRLGNRSICKECRNADTREYHRTHREAICARKRARRLEAKAALLRQQLKTPVADIAAKDAQIEQLQNQLMELQAVPRVVDTDMKVQIKDPIKVNMEAVPKTLKDYWLAIGLFILWITTVVVGVFR